MHIWVDADACPKIIKEVLFRAAKRRKITLILVANQSIQIPPSPYIQKIQVSTGFDVADKTILEKMNHGDLVITADIPLADAVIAKGGVAINPRGLLYTKENIKQRLSIRNLNEERQFSSLSHRGNSTPKTSQRDNKSRLYTNMISLMPVSAR